jgi:anti-sigma factor RsiW
MKPCAKNRKWIAWLALDALEAQQARELRAHIAACEGCRRYLEETSKMTRALKEAQTRTQVAASESFHRKVARAIRAQESWSFREALAASFRGTSLRWRAALSVLGAMAVAIVALSLLASRFRTGSVPSPAPSSARAVSAPSFNSDLPPTLANYRLAANRSLEDLDALLTRQGNRNRSPVPIYRASTLALADLAD